MSQPSITSYFASRKRPATDDLHSSKTKLLVLSDAGPAHRPRHVKLLPFKESQDASSARTDSHLPRATAETKTEIGDVAVSPPTETVATEKCVPFTKKLNAANITKNHEEIPRRAVENEARKELSLGDLKSKLMNRNRLSELKASAARLGGGFLKLKELENKKSHQGEYITLEVPISPRKRLQDGLLSPKKPVAMPASVEMLAMSPRKVVISPVKSPTKVPAYIKQASLGTTSAQPLPRHYQFLAEVFRGIETVASLLFNRRESITFGKLRPSVQEMLKRNITEKHLAQIKSIAPDFYSYEIHKVKSFSATNQKQQYELLVSPILPQEVTSMNPTIILERRRQFFDRLITQVKQHHTKFLLTLDPPMIVPDDKLVRWHPQFELEKVPEVECSKLPEMPNHETYSTAEDVLTKARELFSCNTRMERALNKLAQAKARGLTEQEKNATGLNEPEQSNSVQTQTNIPGTSTKNVTLLNPALRNLPTALLEKIKAKQAAKALEAMTRSAEDEKKWIIYSRLPDLARTLRNIFVTERKNVLALNVVVSKLDSTFQYKVSAPDLRADIKLLSEALPQWVTLLEVRNNTYLKLDRSANLEDIKGKLQDLADKYKNV